MCSRLGEYGSELQIIGEGIKPPPPLLISVPGPCLILIDVFFLTSELHSQHS